LSTSRGIRKLIERTFEKLLGEAIDDALQTLGDSARQSIYFHLENKFKVTKDDIPHRLEDFEQGLEGIFGPGSRFLEILIMKKLFEKTGSPLDWDETKELLFVDYVKVARRNYSRKE